MGVKDSKKMSERQRERVFNYIKNNKEKFNFVICKFTPKMIDELGLSTCYQNGLKLIYDFFKDKDSNFVFDGNTLYGADLPIQTVPKAEDKFIEVALASIIAKVKRDKEIEEIAKQYPQYQWNKHKGYPQKAHKEAIEKYGIIRNIHRESWGTIKKLENYFYYKE
jgi:ribonuclease HII